MHLADSAQVQKPNKLHGSQSGQWSVGISTQHCYFKYDIQQLKRPVVPYRSGTALLDLWLVARMLPGQLSLGAWAHPQLGLRWHTMVVVDKLQGLVPGA